MTWLLRRVVMGGSWGLGAMSESLNFTCRPGYGIVFCDKAKGIDCVMVMNEGDGPMTIQTRRPLRGGSGMASVLLTCMGRADRMRRMVRPKS